MRFRTTGLLLAASAFLPLLSVLSPAAGLADEGSAAPCREDAMLVFDGSGSMSGTETFGIGSMVTRIDKVRKALGRVLPDVEGLRNLGLITIGPRAFDKCDDVALKLRPSPNAGVRIMAEVDAINPSGRTPLAAAVAMAADVLEFRRKPAVIVVLTDGDDTCGGAPCVLARKVKAEGKSLILHVIGYRVKDWVGEKGFFESRCLADETGGPLYHGRDDGRTRRGLPADARLPVHHRHRPVTARARDRRGPTPIRRGLRSRRCWRAGSPMPSSHRRFFA